MTNRLAQRQGDFALRFFFASATVFSIAGTLSWLLIKNSNYVPQLGELVFPPALLSSTVLLLLGSGTLHVAVQYVRIERQIQFRRSLLLALCAGTTFVSIQSYALWCLLQNQDPEEVETGANAFVIVFGALHFLHFTVALLFLVFVTLRGLMDRYDHEYYFGVTVCAYFWHVLGAAWLFILGVLGIALSTS